MAYYLEIKFFGETQPWQRNPNPFPSWDEADHAGREFIADHQLNPEIKKKMWETTRQPLYAPDTVNVEYRVVGR